MDAHTTLINPLALEAMQLERFDAAGRDTWPDLAARIPGWHPRNEDPPPPVDPPADPPADPPPADKWTPPTKAEYEAMLEQGRTTQAELLKIQKVQQAAERKRAEEQGEFKTLAEAEKARADAAEAKLEKRERDAAATKIAGGMNFKRPESALAIVRDQDPAAVDDDAKLTKALKDLAKDQPELLSTTQRTTRGSVDGEGNNGADMNSILRRAAGRT